MKRFNLSHDSFARTLYRPLLALVCLSVSNSLLAQEPAAIAYVTVQGSKQGNFRGAGNGPGEKVAIECIGFSYTVQEALDQASGQPMGKRSHSPFVIVKHLDVSTPMFLQAAYNNETLKTVTIELTKRTPDGKTVVAQSIKLTNALISRVSQFGGTTSPDKQLLNGAPFEEISLTFQKIEFQDIEGKIGTADNWSTNR